MLKLTYRTGCFALLNTSGTLVQSQNQMLGTIAYQFDGKPTYALKGLIFFAGAVMQWLRGGLEIIRQASEAADIDASTDLTQSLYRVPAFTGLDAPYWDAECKGTVFGLTRNSGPRGIVKAALQGVGYQTCDLLMVIQDDMGASGHAIRRLERRSAADFGLEGLLGCEALKIIIS